MLAFLRQEAFNLTADLSYRLSEEEEEYFFHIFESVGGAISKLEM